MTGVEDGAYASEPVPPWLLIGTRPKNASFP